MSRSNLRPAHWSLVGGAVLAAVWALNLRPHPVSVGALPDGNGVVAVRAGQVYLSEVYTSSPGRFRLSLLTPGGTRELYRLPSDQGRASVAAVVDGTAFVVVSPPARPPPFKTRLHRKTPAPAASPPSRPASCRPSHLLPEPRRTSSATPA